MTYRAEAARFSAGRGILAAVALAAVLAGSGCASDINEGVGPATSVPSLSGSQARDTGTYPNLNIRPQAAATQITPEQRAATGTKLSAASHRAQAGAGGQTMSAEEQARLKKLAEDRGASVLAEIEAQQ